YPRLSIVRTAPPADDDAVLGPFASRAQAQACQEAVEEAFALRRCTPRLPLVPRVGASACVLAEMGRCGAPCTGRQSVTDYDDITTAVREALSTDAGPVVRHLHERIATLATAERYEDAALERDRLRAFLVGARRAQRLRPL